LLLDELKGIIEKKKMTWCILDGLSAFYIIIIIIE
jgi:hypothetical protein